MPDLRKGVIFLKAKIPGNLQDHLVAISQGTRTMDALQPAVRQPARRSASGRDDGNFPTYYDPDDEEEEGYDAYGGDEEYDEDEDNH